MPTPTCLSSQPYSSHATYVHRATSRWQFLSPFISGHQAFIQTIGCTCISQCGSLLLDIESKFLQWDNLSNTSHPAHLSWRFSTSLNVPPVHAAADTFPIPIFYHSCTPLWVRCCPRNTVITQESICLCGHTDILIPPYPTSASRDAFCPPYTSSSAGPLRFWGRYHDVHGFIHLTHSDSFRRADLRRRARHARLTPDNKTLIMGLHTLCRDDAHSQSFGICLTS